MIQLSFLLSLPPRWQEQWYVLRCMQYSLAQQGMVRNSNIYELGARGSRSILQMLPLVKAVM